MPKPEQITVLFTGRGEEPPQAVAARPFMSIYRCSMPDGPDKFVISLPVLPVREYPRAVQVANNQTMMYLGSPIHLVQFMNAFGAAMSRDEGKGETAPVLGLDGRPVVHDYLPLEIHIRTGRKTVSVFKLRTAEGRPTEDIAAERADAAATEETAELPSALASSDPDPDETAH